MGLDLRDVNNVHNRAGKHLPLEQPLKLEALPNLWHFDIHIQMTQCAIHKMPLCSVGYAGFDIGDQRLERLFDILRSPEEEGALPAVPSNFHPIPHRDRRQAEHSHALDIGLRLAHLPRVMPRS